MFITTEKKISTHINKPYMGHLQWQMLQSRLILHTMEDQLSRNATIKNTFCPNLARGGKKIAGASNNRVTPTTNASTMSIRFLQWLHWCYSCQISIPIRSLSPASFSLFFFFFFTILFNMYKMSTQSKKKKKNQNTICERSSRKHFTKWNKYLNNNVGTKKPGQRNEWNHVRTLATFGSYIFFTVVNEATCSF